MKKILLSAVFSAFALMSLSSSATSLSFVGPADIDWTVYQQGAYLPPSYTTNHPSSKQTNIVSVYKGSFTSMPFGNADLLNLLENSFKTNLPTGSRLATDGQNLYVVDKTGSNVVLDISSVVTVDFVNSVYKYMETDTQIFKGSSETFSGVYSDPSTIAYVQLSYDDSNMTTTDGTRSTFTFSGLSTAQESGHFASGTPGSQQETFRMPGAGNGTIRGKTSVIGGTVTGSAHGASD